MQHLPRALLPGRPYPLGATWDGLGINFAVFSANAEKIELCLFEPSGRHEIARYAMPEYTDESGMDICRTRRSACHTAIGRMADMTLNKAIASILTSCCWIHMRAALAGTVHWSDTLYGFRVNSPRGDLSFDRRDSAPAMPKSVVIDDSFNWGDDRPPACSLVRYRNLRGTCARTDHAAREGPPTERGTFAALAHPGDNRPSAAAGHHRDRAAADARVLQDRALQQRGLRNYWGYNTLAFLRRSHRIVGSVARTRCAWRSAGCTPPASR